MGKLNQAMTDLLRYNAAILPQKRSVFNKSHSHATCLDSAWLVPIMWDRVLPGDEKKIRYSGLARMATPLHPTMDEAFLDTWAFFVPDRLWWTHAREFYGENKDASFNPDGDYVMPYLTPSRYHVSNSAVTDDNPNGLGGLNDYFGFPVMNVGNRFDDYPEYYATAGLHRCYQLIWDEYYRNSSVQPALELNDGDTVTDAEWRVISKLRRVNKLPDYFTTCLLTPQAGDDVLLPLGQWAPVVTRSDEVDASLVDSSINGQYLKLGYVAPVGWRYDPTDQVLGLTGTSGALTATDDAPTLNSSAKYTPSNLWANLQSATAMTINDLRAAITVQQFLEISAIGGKRYQQILRAHFGTFVPDATIQRPLLLGATRTTIGMRQVLQTSARVGDGTPQGNASAVSVTNVANEWICNHAFVEPGFLIVMAAIRPSAHSYSQGLDCLLTKLQPYDHYWPVFDNIGNQPVYSKELWLAPDVPVALDPEEYKDTVFGYKSAWSEYKMKSNRVSGYFRPDVMGSLSSWNYSSYFDGEQFLSDEFVREDENLIDRTIAVPSEPQFLLDSYFEYTDIKNMSVHSTPGLTRL